MVERTYPVITLCGSTKFKAAFEEFNTRLSLQGFMVLSVGGYLHSGDLFDEAELDALHKLHLAKIDISDAIFVLNVGGYIGETTKKEIEYARQKGKRVLYMEPTDLTWNYHEEMPAILEQEEARKALERRGVIG